MNRIFLKCLFPFNKENPTAVGTCWGCYSIDEGYITNFIFALCNRKKLKSEIIFKKYTGKTDKWIKLIH